VEINDILLLYGQLLSSVDQWFDGCLASAPGRIECSRGCCHCCRGLFDITLLDACYLKSGFDKLDEGVKRKVREKAAERLEGIRALWPEFAPPYTINHRAEEEWQAIMPEGDETPCVLLDDQGRCLVYDHRPMTCRLHGIPLVDCSGEVMDGDVCTLNFVGVEAALLPELRFPFIDLFRDEAMLFQTFTEYLLKYRLKELDTVIPAATLLAFDETSLAGVGPRLVPGEH
jgi:Fe-S-cluster containining protein